MATYSQQPLTVFILSLDALDRLANLFAERVGKIGLRVECADGLSYEFGAVSELSKLENSEHSRIRTLILTAQSEDRRQRASVSFLDSRWSSVSLEFTGPNESVVILREAALDVLAGLRPWYEPLARTDFVRSFLTGMEIAIFVLAVLFVSLFAFKWQPLYGTPTFYPSDIALGMLIGWGLFAGGYFGGKVLNRIRDAVCPPAAFLIGQGTNRFDVLEKVRWTIVIGFLVSVAASIVAAGLLARR